MQRCFAVAALAILFGATCAWTQTYQFDIPFAFHVGEVQLSAGSYTVMYGQPFASMVTLKSRASAKDKASTPIFSDKPVDHTKTQPKLVFNRYGSKGYFLSQIWDPGLSSSMRAVKSEHEIVTSTLIAGLWPEKVEIRATRLVDLL